MRRVICLIAVLLICVSVACPVFAATDTFVPSISYKDGPEIVDSDLNGEDVTKCLEVTSILEAEKKTTDIRQEDRDLLLEVYEKLDDGTMKLPLEHPEDYVIRELVDVSFTQTGCVGAGHPHKEWLEIKGNTITIDFDLGVKKSTEVTVFAYIDGQWQPIQSATNKGNGIISCVFEDICPVAFCVEFDAEDESAKTGDDAQLGLWIGLMAVSFGGILVLSVSRRKFAR